MDHRRTGILRGLAGFRVEFHPPSQINVGSNTVWFAVLIIGCIVVVATPFIIYSLRKPSWKDPKAEIAPFHWEEQPVAPVTSATSTSPATPDAKNKNIKTFPLVPLTHGEKRNARIRHNISIG